MQSVAGPGYSRIPMADTPGAESKDQTGGSEPPLEKRPPAPPAIARKAWGDPLARFDKRWTNFESRLCAWVLMAEVAALCLWIALKGLSAEYQTSGEGDKNVSGIVFRSLITATFLGLAAHRATRPRLAPTDKGFEQAEQRHRVVVTISVIVGLACGRLWANGGVGYFSNLLNWMQGASLLALIGGLRGVATRLTLWLALLGASIATAKGKHINIDVVMRFRFAGANRFTSQAKKTMPAPSRMNAHRSAMCATSAARPAWPTFS